MPKYNELKHFNPAKIAEQFITELAGSTRVGKLMVANGVSGDPSNTMTFY